MLFPLLSLCAAFDVAILASDKTPFSAQDLVNQLSTSLAVGIKRVNSSAADLANEVWPSVVLDYSYSPGVSLRLAEVTKGLEVVCMYEMCSLLQGRAGLSAEATAEQIAAYLQAFNYTQFFLGATVTPFYQQVASHLTAQDFLTFTQVAYLREELSSGEVEQFVGRVLKPSGSTVAVLLVDEVTGTVLYPALQQYNLYKEGYVYIFSAEAVWTTRPEGALYAIESVAVNATSRLQFEALILHNLLTRMTISQGFYPSRDLVLVNIKAGRPVVTTTLSNVLFPGNTSAPSIQKPIIEVSADLTGLNFDGSVYPSGTVMTFGMVIGYREANIRRDLVPNFQFSLQPVHLGAMYFNLSWALTQLYASRTHIGIAHHPLGFTSTIMGICHMFASQNMTVPTTTISTGSELSDPVKFPYYLRTMSSNMASARIIIRFFQLFQWKRTAIIYSDEASQVLFYHMFAELAAESGITITNSESLRQVPLNPQGELNTTLQEIMASTVRVIVIAHSQCFLIAERLYDLGARAGDYMVCLYYCLSYTQFGGADEASRKRRNVMRGAMMFYDRYFAGLEGPRVKELLQQANGDHYDPVSCVYYDSVMLVVHAVDFMLAKGLHYEEGRELVTMMRNTRFNGCLGIIQIEPESNDRRPGDYSVMNAHLEGENETLLLVDAAIYSPTRAQLFTLLPELQFPDGSSSSFPDSWVNDANCPYLAKDVRDFPAGMYVSLFLGLSFTVLMAMFCLVIYKYCWNTSSAALANKTPMSIEDGLFMCTAFIEFLQLLALGPSQEMPEVLVSALAMVGFGPEHASFLCAVVTLVLVCVFLALSLFKFVVRNPKCWALSLIDSLSELVLPFVGVVCFVPIYHTLLQAFACFRSTGEDFSSSFLNDYCEMHCWQDTHIKVVIVAALLLCLYVPVALFTRPLWQELHPNLHIKASSQDLFVYAQLQMTLTTLQIALGQTHPVVQCILYLVLTALYLLSSFFTHPYNYERFSLWRQLMVGGAWLYGFIGLISEVVNVLNATIWALVLGACWGGVVLLGVLLQVCVLKYRSLLVREKEDRSDIIRFAFTFGAMSAHYLARFRGRTRLLYIERVPAAEKEGPARVPNTTAAELIESHNSP